MDDATLNQIIQDKWNNMQVSKKQRKRANTVSDSGGDDSGSIQRSPGLDALKKKYLGTTDAGDEAIFEADSATEGDEDTDVRLIESKNKDEQDSTGPKERAVIVSKTKGVIGSEG